MINKNDDNRPVFQRALGDDWSKVSPLVRQHYDLATHSDEEIIFEGEMSVWYPLPAIVLLVFVRLIGGLVLLREKGLKVRVKNNSRPDDAAMHWHRTFHLPNKKKADYFPLTHGVWRWPSGNRICRL